MVVTAGPTHEPLDPVRYIGNHSTGLMGYAIANALANHGAQVTIISGPVALPAPTNPLIKTTKVQTALQMLTATQQAFTNADAAVFAAAVADFRPTTTHVEKIKKENATNSIALTQNPDIAATISATKKNHQRTIGFALETGTNIEVAITKLNKKNLDLIIFNTLADQGAGFAHNTNKITIINKQGHATPLPLKTKKDAAKDIVTHIEKLFNA